MVIQLTESSIVPDEMILFSMSKVPNGQWVLDRDHGGSSRWIMQTYAWSEGLIDAFTEVVRHRRLHWDLVPCE